MHLLLVDPPVVLFASRWRDAIDTSQPEYDDARVVVHARWRRSGLNPELPGWAGLVDRDILAYVPDTLFS